MALWLKELAGPIIDPARLTSVLVASLRKEGRAELADAVAALLRDAQGQPS